MQGPCPFPLRLGFVQEHLATYLASASTAKALEHVQRKDAAQQPGPIQSRLAPLLRILHPLLLRRCAHTLHPRIHTCMREPPASRTVDCGRLEMGEDEPMKVLSTLSGDKTRRVAAIDRSLLGPIGELTVNFAMLEQIVKHGIELLLFPDGDNGWAHVTSSMVTSEMSFRRLVDLLQCLVSHRCSEGDAELCKELCLAMGRLEERRNAIIHSNWAIDGSSGATIRLKTTAKGKGLRHHEEVLTSNDISKIADEIAAVAKRLGDFLQPQPNEEPPEQHGATK